MPRQATRENVNSLGSIYIPRLAVFIDLLFRKQLYKPPSVRPAFRSHAHSLISGPVLDTPTGLRTSSLAFAFTHP